MYSENSKIGLYLDVYAWLSPGEMKTSKTCFPQGMYSLVDGHKRTLYSF